jgi:hypothetical protein
MPAMMEVTFLAGDIGLQERADQHQIRRARRQQGDRERCICFEGCSHHSQNIQRFYPGSLGDYFHLDSGVVYDSGTSPPNTGAQLHVNRPSPD